MNGVALLRDVLQERIQEKRTEKDMKEKTCTKCGKTKTLDLFYKQASSKDGYHPWCKKCHNLYTVMKKNGGSSDKESTTAEDQKPTVAPVPEPAKDQPEKMITCSRCGKEKPATLEYFHSNSSKKSGLDSSCKACRNLHKKKTRISTETSIVLDFTDHPETLGKIKEWAHAELRDPGKQIVFYLKKKMGA